MKKNIHPKYQKVLFVDSSTGSKFICGSTLQPEEKETFEGTTYPVYRLSISAASHPLFTGSKQLVDAEGRVQQFHKRYAAKPAKPAEEKPAIGPKKGVKEKKPVKGKNPK